VTHHVELVLPGAYYLVRMLDGRIDTQGTIETLRDQGVLDIIEQDAAIQVYQENILASKTPTDIEVTDEDNKQTDESKKPRKLISEEHREIGGVKWSIFKTYLQASYVDTALFPLSVCL
jgi:hypothetical protein